MKPLCIDLCCGDFGGWAEGFLSEGYDVVGFDIVRNLWSCYPGQLVLQDILTLHGSQLRHATAIVASPPCQAYSYRAMPWKRARALPPPDNSLFEACFRIQREACEAAGRRIPLVVENVRGAQKWVGRAVAHFGSFYLWGDVPALLPVARSQKFNPDGTCHPPGSWFAVADSKNRGVKSQGQDWSRFTKTGEVSGHWRLESAGIKLKSPGHYRKPGSGPDWYDGGAAAFGSHSDKRKIASAVIAKIPFPLAQHMARAFKPASTKLVGTGS